MAVELRQRFEESGWPVLVIRSLFNNKPTLFILGSVCLTSLSIRVPLLLPPSSKQARWTSWSAIWPAGRASTRRRCPSAGRACWLGWRGACGSCGTPSGVHGSRALDTLYSLALDDTVYQHLKHMQTRKALRPAQYLLCSRFQLVKADEIGVSSLLGCRCAHSCRLSSHTIGALPALNYNYAV